MQIAYLVLAHTAPKQVIRIMEALRPSACLFVVHIDARADDAVYDELVEYAKTVDDVVFVKRQRCYWGSYGIMTATFRCIRKLLESKREFDYAVLLSGADYPIKPAAAISAFFEEHKRDEHIEAFPLDEPNRWTPMEGRFQSMARVMFWSFTYHGKWINLDLPRRFYKGWRPHGGSQWWALSHDAVVWIDQYFRKHPGVSLYFRFVFIPDESMIQTMIANSPFRDRTVKATLHYIDWERPNPDHPRTLDDEDFERVRAAPFLYARKISETRSAALLDRIDKELLG